MLQSGSKSVLLNFNTTIIFHTSFPSSPTFNSFSSCTMNIEQIFLLFLGYYCLMGESVIKYSRVIDTSKLSPKSVFNLIGLVVTGRSSSSFFWKLEAKLRLKWQLLLQILHQPNFFLVVIWFIGEEILIWVARGIYLIVAEISLPLHASIRV